MDKPQFVYVTYIASTPEKVWDALLNSEMTRQYWGIAKNVSDWKVGSQWKHVDYENPEVVKIVGNVVEFDPPHRLVITWAAPPDAEDESKHSRVTFEIDPFLETVRLTVTHDGFEADSPMFKAISQGWPGVLSGLKSLLETGQLALAG